MSSILKALKKIETEKSRREHQTSNIGLDILREGQRPATRKLRGWWVLSGLILAGLAGGIALWLVPRNPTLPVISVPNHQSEVAAKSPPAEDQLPAPASLKTSASSVPFETPAKPASVVRRPRLKPAPAPVASAPPKVSPTQNLVPSKSPLPSPSGAGNGLTLQGIVWQDDAAARMAIINDLPVMKGTRIEDATVEEILADRVKLSRQGIPFELILIDR